MAENKEEAEVKLAAVIAAADAATQAAAQATAAASAATAAAEEIRLRMHGSARVVPARPPPPSRAMFQPVAETPSSSASSASAASASASASAATAEDGDDDEASTSATESAEPEVAPPPPPPASALFNSHEPVVAKPAAASQPPPPATALFGSPSDQPQPQRKVPPTIGGSAKAQAAPVAEAAAPEAPPASADEDLNKAPINVPDGGFDDSDDEKEVGFSHQCCAVVVLLIVCGAHFLLVNIY